MAIKPTVIGGAPASPGTPAPSTAPTIIGQPTQRPTALPAATPQPTAVAAAAALTADVSRLRGIERKALRVERSELARRHPGVDTAVLERAVAVLGTVTPEVFDEAACAAFGLAAQRRFGEIVDRHLKLLHDESVRSAPRHLARLHALLTEVGEALQPPGLLSLKRESARERLNDARPEIDQLRGLLEAGIAPLTQAQAQLQQLGRDAAELFAELSALTIACDDLAERFGGERAHALAERGLSIAKTAGLLQEHQLQTAAAARELAQLVARIHDGVLVALPAWTASVLTAADTRQTDTQRYVLRNALAELLRQLNGP